MARDLPLTTEQRRQVAKVVARNQKQIDARKKREHVQNAYEKALQLTGDPRIAERYRKAAAQGKGETVPTAAEVRAGTRSVSNPSANADVMKAGIGVPSLDNHLIGKTGQNLIEAGVGAIPGTIAAGLAVGRDASDDLRGRDHSYKRSRKIGKAVVKQTVETVQHPLRRPGDTLLLGLGAASAVAGGAARVGAAGRAAEAAGAAGDSRVAAALARAPKDGGSLLRKPLPEHRIHKLNDIETQSTYSRNPLTAAIQKQIDKREVAQAEKGNVGPLARRVARTGERNRIIEEDVGRAPIVAAQKAGRKLTAGQQMALRLHATQTTVDDRMALVKNEIVKAKDPKVVAQLRREAGLLEAARPYMVERGTKVGLSKDFVPPRRTIRKGANPEELRRQAARDILGTRTREKQGVELGLLDPANLAERRNAEGRIVAGAKMGDGLSLSRGDTFRSHTGKETPAADIPEILGERADHRNLMDAEGNVIGSIVFDARPTLQKVMVKSIYLDPKARGTRRNLQKLLEPALQDGRPIDAAFDNPRLGKIFQRMQDTGRMPRLPEGSQTRLVGGEDARPGLSYVPAGRRKAKSVVFRPFQSRTGAVPNVSAEVKSSLKQFTGHNVRTGGYRHDTTQAIAESNAAMNRQHQAVRLHQRLVSAGVSVRPADTVRLKWEPVRRKKLDASQNEALRALTAKMEQGDDLSRSERAVYDKAVADLHLIEPAVEAHGTPVGETMKDVVWVPKPVFDRISGAGSQASADTHSTARIASNVLHEASSLMRGLVLYSKGGGAGYVAPNFTANVILLAMQGGPKLAATLLRQESKFPRFNRDLGVDALAKMDAAMGEGGIVATFTENARRGKPISGFNNKVASTLGRVTDTPTRRLSFRYEAALRGYKTPEQVQSLLNDPDNKHDLTDITIRARDASLDYSLMSPAERKYIASWAFVFAFLRASSRYTAAFPLEHPYQAAVMTELARNLQEDDPLKARPSSAEGLVEIGKRGIPELSHVGRFPVVSNANALSPLSALPDIARTVTSVVPGGPQQKEFEVSDSLNPALRVAINSIEAYDPFLGKKLEGSLLQRLGDQALGQVPVVRDARAWGPAGNASNLDRKLYPKSRKDILAGEFLGSIAPKPYNPEVAEELARRDYLAGLSPDKRAYVHVFEERNAFFKEAQKATGATSLPAGVKQAYNRYAERSAIRARAIDGTTAGTLARAKRRAVADLTALRNWGVIDQNTKLYLSKLAHRSSTKLELEEMENAIDRKMASAYRDDITDIRRVAKDKGVELPHATLPG